MYFYIFRDELGRWPRSLAVGDRGEGAELLVEAGAPVISIAMSRKKLCPVHRSFFAMSGIATRD